MLCVPEHGSWFFLLVCHAQGALRVRYQQKYMFLGLIWLSFRIVQVIAPRVYRLMNCIVWWVSLPGVVCLMHPHDFLVVHLFESCTFRPEDLPLWGRFHLGTFWRSDTRTEFPGIWTYLRRDVDIFSIWAFLRAIRQRILRGRGSNPCPDIWPSSAQRKTVL